MTTSSPPTVLQCTSTAEFLASLPLLLGYHAEDSVVLVLFHKRQARCAVRLDLPDRDTPFSDTGMEPAVTELIDQFSWVTSVAVVLYTHDTFATNSTAPYALFAVWLERVIHMQHIVVSQLCCVAADGWSSYRDASPITPRPLAEIERTTQAHQHLIGDTTPIESLRQHTQAPTPNQALQHALLTAVQDTATVNIATCTESDFQRLLHHCTRALQCGLTEDSIADCAVLVRCTDTLPTWLIPVILLTAGADLPPAHIDEEVWGAFLQLLQNPRHTPPCGGETVAHRLTMFSSERLPSTGIKAARTRLLRLASHTPEAFKPGVLGLTAWVWWMSGLSSPATQLGREAQQLAPEHPVVSTITSLISQGPPLWVFHAT